MIQPLEPGIHTFSIDKFIETYCLSQERQIYSESILQVFEFCKQTRAKSIFIGGSFITDKPTPNDIDFLIVYERDDEIPRQIESLTIASINLDIMFASYEDNKSIDSFLHLFAHDRNGVKRGIVQIKIDIKELQYVFPITIDKEKLEIIKKAYTGRNIVERNSHKGILISIHGLMSKAEWNVDIAPIASSQGWIFAPYVYKGNWPDLLFFPWKRKKTLENFRHWIYDICQRYSNYTLNISLVGHSYGTYLIGAYLNGYDISPVEINSVILTGSILNKNYNWDKHFDEIRVGRVLNIYSTNDKLVQCMPNKNFKRIIGMDKLFGNAGYSGFSCTNNFLIQRELEILNHTNTIKRDIIETVWMPFLNLNNNSLSVNQMEKWKQK